MVTTVLHDAGGIDAGPASVTRRRALAWCAAAAIGSVGSVGGVAHAAVAASPLSASPVTAASAHGAPRVVVLDWPLTEIVLSLGVVPVGVARPPWYMRVDGDPPLPSGVTDTGLLFQPNFEVLDALNELRNIGRALHAWVVPEQASIPEAWKHFSENGALSNAALEKRLREVGKQVARFARVHKCAGARDFLELWEKAPKNPGGADR